MLPAVHLLGLQLSERRCDLAVCNLSSIGPLAPWVSGSLGIISVRDMRGVASGPVTFVLGEESEDHVRVLGCAVWCDAMGDCVVSMVQSV